jgi:hypothetical protein
MILSVIWILKYYLDELLLQMDKSQTKFRSLNVYWMHSKQIAACFSNYLIGWVMYDMDRNNFQIVKCTSTSTPKKFAGKRKHMWSYVLLYPHN